MNFDEKYFLNFQISQLMSVKTKTKKNNENFKS
jgi:hypothetical protein